MFNQSLLKSGSVARNKVKRLKSALLAGTALISAVVVGSPAEAVEVVSNEADLMHAITLANAGMPSADTIVLGADISLTGLLPALNPGSGINYEVVLDLNGHALDGAAVALILNSIGGNVSIIDSASGGNLLGFGGLEQNSSGLFTISASTAYSGGTTLNSGQLILANLDALLDSGSVTINSGVLDLDAFDETIGSLSGSGGSIQLNANTLTVNQSSNGTYNGVIAGTGGLVKQGSKQLILNGANTYSGGTTLVDGQLTVGHNSALGTGAVTFAPNNNATLKLQDGINVGNSFVLYDNSTFRVNGSTTSAEVSGPMSGTGTLIKVGNGELVLSRENISTGGMILKSGSVVLTGTSRIDGAVTIENGNLIAEGPNWHVIGGLFGAGTVQLNDTTLWISQNADSTYNGTITGSGGLIKWGLQDLVLAQNNTFSGSVTVKHGNLILAAPDALRDSITVTLEETNPSDLGTLELEGFDETIGSLYGSGGKVQLNNNTLTLTSGDFGGVIEGSGKVIKSGILSNLILSGDSTFSGGLDLSGPVTALSDNALGTGQVSFYGQSARIFLGNVNIANNLVSPVQSGITFFYLNVESGYNAEISGNVDILNSESSVQYVTVEDGASLVISGDVTGSYRLRKYGGGTLTLSGYNVFEPGSFSVASAQVYGGVLLNTGTMLNASVSVEPGTIFGGSGFTDTIYAVGGIYAPGYLGITSASADTLIIVGGSTFQVRVDAAGNSDFVDVSQDITIGANSTLSVLAEDGTYAPQTQYTIAHAGGSLAVSFDNVTSSLAFLDPSYQIVGNDLILTLDLISAAGQAQSEGQYSVGSAIDTILRSGSVSESQQLAFHALYADLDQMAAGLSQASGAGYGSLTSSTMANAALHVTGLNRHLNEARACAGGACEEEQPSDLNLSSVERMLSQNLASQAQTSPWGNGSVWMQNYGGSQSLANGQGSFNMTGIQSGYDRWLSGKALVGFSVTYAEDRYDGLASFSEGQTEYTYVSAYGSYSFGKSYANAIVSFSSADFETTRSLSFGDYHQLAKADFNSHTTSLYGEVGHDVKAGQFNLQPYANVTLMHVEREGFTETGANALNLNAEAQTLTSFQGGLGLRFTTQWQSASGLMIRPEGYVGYSHEFGSAAGEHQSVLRFAGTNAAFATLDDATGYKDAMNAGFGIDLSRGGNLHLKLNYDFLASDAYQMHAATGRLLWGF